MKKHDKGFLFKSIQAAAPRYSRFDLSFRNTMTLQLGVGTPTLSRRLYPGDEWFIETNAMAKSLPMVAPCMTEIDLYIDTFFVPLRILIGDENYDKYLNNEISLPHWDLSSPDMSFEDLQKLGAFSSISHFTGFPHIESENDPNGANNIVNAFKTLPPISKIYTMAYLEIFNQYYRDEWIEDEIDYGEDGRNIGFVQNNQLKRIKYPKDYFTGALPFPQAGEPVTLPLGNSAPVKFKTSAPNQQNFAKNPLTGAAMQGDITAQSGGVLKADNTNTAIDNSANLWTDLSEATSTTINTIRQAFALQRFREAFARGGGRAKEIIYNMFGVETPDYRLDRPEYLGGSRTVIGINSVQQTSQTTEDSPLGSQAANGIGVTSARTRDGRYKVKEHGYIMQIAYILPRQAYFQGISRELTITDVMDEYWKEFEHIGEQDLKLYEVWTPSNNLTTAPVGSLDLNKTFGYQPRYSNFKYNNDELHGLMITDLFHWQGARAFGSEPALNTQFLSSSPQDLDHLFPADSGDVAAANKWVITFNHYIDAIRPMDAFGTPKM